MKHKILASIRSFALLVMENLNSWLDAYGDENLNILAAAAISSIWVSAAFGSLSLGLSVFSGLICLSLIYQSKN